MSRTKEPDFSKFREPTNEEIEKVSKWMGKHHNQIVQTGKILSFISAAMFLILIIGISVKSVNVIPTSVIAIFFLLASLLSIKNIINANSELENWRKGNFLVIDGNASKIENSADMPGYDNVWFVSNDELYQNGPFLARQEELHVGSKLIVVYPNPYNKKRQVPHIFSEFMLKNNIHE